MEQDFAKFLIELKETFGDGKITSQRLGIITPRVIQFVQKLGEVHKLSGQEKKDLFFQIIDKLIDDVVKTDDADDLKDFTRSVLPFIVDAIVYAYKSKAFDHIHKQTKKCIARCT